MVNINMSILAPSVVYNYHVRGGQAFWHQCDDSLNVYDGEDNTICITGIKARAAFLMARNMMCANKNIFDELTALDEHQLDMAKEMLSSLRKYVRKQELMRARETMKG